MTRIGIGLLRKAQSGFETVWRFLARLDVAAALMLVALLPIAIGSCFPQLSTSVAANAEQSARWQADVQARYGALTGWLAALGVFHWFRSPIFLVCSGLLCLATAICTLDRWRSIWRQTFHSPIVPSNAVFDVAPYKASLTMSSVMTLPGILGQQLLRLGFQVHSERLGQDLYLRGDRNRLAGLATLVNHLAVLLLLIGTLLSSIYGWREELVISPGGRAEIEHASPLAVSNRGFSIVRYPDHSVADYRAEVTILEADQGVRRGSLRVNGPLDYKGVQLYLRGYEQKEGGYDITLLAVHDPGYGLVIAAGCLLLLGMTVSFSFPRCWIHARLQPDGALRLAAWPTRRVYDFGPEFALLVNEMRRWADAADS